MVFRGSRLIQSKTTVGITTMKKIILVLTFMGSFLGGSFSGSQVALANGFNLFGGGNTMDAENQPPKFYGGLSLGLGKHPDTCDQAFFDSRNCENSSMAWKTFAGVKVNPMLGIEGGYRNAGETKLNGVSTGGDDVSLDKKLTGFDISAVGFMPLSPEMEAFGKAGIFHWNQEEVTLTNGETRYEENSGNSLMIGAGAQYILNQNMRLRGEWEHMFDTGDETSSSTDVDQLSLGFSFSSL